MEKVTILIMDQDEAYREALCRYFNRMEQWISAKEMAMGDFLKGDEVTSSFDWYLVNEGLEERIKAILRDKDLRKRVFLLTEKRSSYRKDFAKSLLFKYQTPEKMMAIIRERGRLLAGSQNGKLRNWKEADGFSIGEYEAKGSYRIRLGAVICSVFGSEEGCGATALTVGLAKTLSRQGKRCLYLNLEPYPTKIFCRYENKKRNAEELAYRLIYGKEEDYMEKWDSFVGKDETGVSYLYFEPGKNPFLALEEGEFELLLDRIREKGPYDYIFLDSFKGNASQREDGMMSILLEKSRGMVIVYDGSVSTRHKAEAIREKILQEGFSDRSLTMVCNKSVEDRKEKNEIAVAFDKEAFGVKGEGISISMEGPFGRDMGKLAKYLQSKLLMLH